MNFDGVNFDGVNFDGVNFDWRQTCYSHVCYKLPVKIWGLYINKSRSSISKCSELTSMVELRWSKL